ncbi:MAG: hypothetical protein ABI481_01815 [Pyrinomonadaceae bacterium]
MASSNLKPEPLLFARGVRFPRKNELPGDTSDAWKRISDARITTGYVLQTTGKEFFDTYIEANVHAPNVFEVFRNLVFALMPEVAAPIIGMKEEEPLFGPYTYRALALAVFEPFADLLQNDGFLEFGMIHQSEAAFEEIFVASPKYFKIWTNHGADAEEVLQAAGIPRRDKLEFIDEYPMVSVSLGNDGDAAWAGPFYAIQDEFPKLPKVEGPIS